MEEKARLAYATIAQPGTRTETDSLILGQSIRSFGGSIADRPIWCFVPETGRSLSPRFRSALERIGMELRSFELEKENPRNWFVPYAQAAANAETEAEGTVDILAWLSPNTVVVQEPHAFLLPKEVSLGYRPVHHALIGSRFDQELDSFWSFVYDVCDAPRERAFPMKTQVENIHVRPYFNAGFLIVRPELSILRNWRDLFFSICSLPDLTRFYEADNRYQIFIHQAILSGVILNKLTTEMIAELPPSYNYPVHLHDEDRTPDRPETMDDTVVFRHEGFYAKQNWLETFPARSQLASWLSERVAEFSKTEKES